MGTSDWLEEAFPRRGGWRSASITSSGRSATTAGGGWTQRWSADNWASHKPVSSWWPEYPADCWLVSHVLYNDCQALTIHEPAAVLNRVDIPDHKQTSFPLRLCYRDSIRFSSAFDPAGAVGVVNGEVFGSGIGHIYMEGVSCTGRETSLAACPHSRETDCEHVDDAGVICQRKL